MNSQKLNSLIQVHISIFLFGSAGIFGKLITLNPFILVFGRVLFASIALYIMMLALKRNIKTKSRKDFWMLILQGVILAIHWVTFFHSIQISTITIGLLAFSTYPIFVTFLEPVFFKDKLQLKDVFVALLSFSGVALVVFDGKAPSPETHMIEGAAWGVVAGLTCALLTIISKQYVDKYSGVTINFYQSSVATIVLSPFIFLIDFEIKAMDLFYVAILGLVFTATALSLLIEAMKHLKAQLVSISACLEPVYGIILAVLFFGESINLRIIVGAAIIIGSTIYATLHSKHDELRTTC